MHLLLPGVTNKTKNAQKSQTLTNGMISLKTRETAHRLSQIGGFVVTYFSEGHIIPRNFFARIKRIISDKNTASITNTILGLFNFVILLLSPSL